MSGITETRSDETMADEAAEDVPVAVRQDGLRASAESLAASEREVRAAREYLRATLHRRNQARADRAGRVIAARDGGCTWKQIGDALGVSIPRVRAIYQAASEGRELED